MRPDLVAGRPVISTRDDAVLAAYVSRLAGTRHVERFQYLGSGLPQIKLNVGRITRLQRPIRARDQFITDVGRNDELVHADFVARHFQPGAVIVEDDQGDVIAPLPFAVPGIPYLFAELLHLDVGEPRRELLGVELE
ncbi:hypothetical protein D3C84_701250 [compost metagenome]